MENIIIPKPSLKFTVEVVSTNNQVTFNVVRYIEVERNETLHTNAGLAKNDALLSNGHYINCNKLIKSAISGMELTIEPTKVKPNCRIVVKKSCTFGH